MAKYYHTDDTIECASAGICAKKKTLKGLFKLKKRREEGDIDGETINCVKFKCERDGLAEITKELSPKVSVVNKNARLNEGDLLDSNMFSFCHEGNRPVKWSKGTYSGRHNTQYCNTKSFTQAIITRPYDHIQNALENRKALEG